ncbi:hypothetical protein MTBUT4_80012 [Magnetospirillum sp. UT-4]|nr:hypothetical protein MTBUT4_80012 [Magnetospirillum sp. UT-4]
MRRPPARARIGPSPPPRPRSAARHQPLPDPSPGAPLSYYERKHYTPGPVHTTAFPRPQPRGRRIAEIFSYCAAHQLGYAQGKP